MTAYKFSTAARGLATYIAHEVALFSGLSLDPELDGACPSSARQLDPGGDTAGDADLGLPGDLGPVEAVLLIVEREQDRSVASDAGAGSELEVDVGCVVRRGGVDVRRVTAVELGLTGEDGPGVASSCDAVANAEGWWILGTDGRSSGRLGVGARGETRDAQGDDGE
jgi:hypothetical protein